MRKLLHKTLLLFLTVTFVMGQCFVMPGGVTETAYAAADKSITNVGVTGINNPRNGAYGGGQWDKVVYCNQNGSPLVWNVLQKSTTDFSDYEPGAKTLLLDCTTIIHAQAYTVTTSRWIDTNNETREWLNDEFLSEGYGRDTSKSRFTDPERGAIHLSVKYNKSSTDGDGHWSDEYNPKKLMTEYMPQSWMSFGESLNYNKIFILDAMEATNTTYGFENNAQKIIHNSNTRIKKAQSGGKYPWYWFLRNNYYGGRYNQTSDTIVDEGGRIGYWHPASSAGDGWLGISPAMNIKNSSIISTSKVGYSGTTAHKLTLKDDEIKLNDDQTETIKAKRSGDYATIDMSKISVTGSRAGNVNRYSVVVVNGEWNDSKGWSQDATLATMSGVPGGDSYTQLDENGKFKLPEGYESDSWNQYNPAEDTHFYLIAEDVNDGVATDYASKPKEIEFVKDMDVESRNQAFTYDGRPHGIVLTVKEPAEGYTVKFGTTEGEYIYDKDDEAVTVTNVSDGEKTIYYQVTADGYETKTGSAKVSIYPAQVRYSGIPDATKVYDGNGRVDLDLSNVTLRGILDADVGNVQLDGSAYVNIINGSAGSYTKVSYYKNMVLTGSAAGNYQLATSGNQINISNVTITKRPVTVSGITAEDKTYDGTTAATLDFSEVQISNAVTGDESGLSVSATGEFENANVGNNKTVNISGITLTGSKAKNYYVANTGNQETATASITEGQMTISVEGAGEFEYNGQARSITVSVTNPTEGATITYGDGQSSSPTYKDAGVYVVPFKVEYQNYETIESQATIRINPRTICVPSGITAEVKEYDATTAATLNTNGAVFQYAGSSSEDFAVVSGDDLKVKATGAYTSPDASGGLPSRVNIIELVLEGDDAANYVLAATGNQKSIIDAQITKRQVKVSGIKAEDKAYDGVTDATLDATEGIIDGVNGEEGVVGGDDVYFLASDGAFENANVGEDKTVGFSVELLGEDAGNYALVTDSQKSAEATIYATHEPAVSVEGTKVTYDGQPHGISVSSSTPGAVIMYGTEQGVYDLDEKPTYTDAGEYVVYFKVTADNMLPSEGAAAVIIAPKDITITGGITAADKVYDGTSNVVLDTSGIDWAACGMVAGDDLGLEAYGSFRDSFAGNNKDVEITEWILTGNSAKNYKMDDNRHQSSTKASISKRSVTVKAKDQTVVQRSEIKQGADEAEVLPATGDNDGLIEGHALSGIKLKSSSTKDVTNNGTITPDDAVITYTPAIEEETAEEPETIDVTANYDIQYEDGVLTVTPLMFKVTYDLNGGEYNGSKANIVEEYQVDTVIKVHDAPVREGYEFQYWQGSKYDPGDSYKVTEDHTLTAQWEKVSDENGSGKSGDGNNQNGSRNDDSGRGNGSSTGDSTHILMWAAVMLAAMLGFIGAAIRRRTRRN